MTFSPAHCQGTSNARDGARSTVALAVKSFVQRELPRVVARCITNEVKGVSRVVYDVSGKPPATIAWE